jgi:GT2 family glycosyltransferase
MAEPDPILVLDLEVGEGAPDVPAVARDGRAYGSAAVLLRLHGIPLGVIETQLRDGRLDADALAARTRTVFGAAIDEHLAADGEGDVPQCRAEHEALLERAAPASVIIATRDGEATLGACLDSLEALDYPAFEVIVVDSASRGDGPRRLVEERSNGFRVPLRYARADLPGLARAHNRGLEEVTGDIVAITDDDVVVDRLWLARLVAAFDAAPDVACVTGLILPYELESAAQIWLDGYWGLGKGFQRRVFDGRADPVRPLHPYTAGAFGSGANMAFRTHALRALGGFDAALGAGSPALGGDDLAAFFDVLAAGHRLVYEPTAVLRHRHRPDYESLRRQAFGYGAGLTAYLARTLADDPRRALGIATRVPRGLAHALAPGSPKNAARPPGFPRELSRIERLGMAVGPVKYLRSRRELRSKVAA